MSMEEGQQHNDRTLELLRGKRIRDVSPGGGFIFAAVHNIQLTVRPENVTIMFETAKKFGRYSIGA